MTTRIHKNISDDEYSAIKNGIKTAHCEINKKIFAGLNVGDVITFFNSNDEKINVYVTQVDVYDRFEDFLIFHIYETLYHNSNVNIEANRYRDMMLNTRDEERYHVVGFKFQVIDSYRTPEKRRTSEFMS